jgi:hypothetical protein
VCTLRCVATEEIKNFNAKERKSFNAMEREIKSFKTKEKEI